MKKERRIGMTICWLTALLVLLSSTASAQSGKLSTWVRQTVKEQKARQKAADGQRRAPEAPRLLTAFVETSDERVLADYGCKTYARLGDISIATIPLSQVEALATHPAVSRIEASPSAHTLMDTVPKLTNLLPVWQQTSQHAAFTGKGVVVGVMDVGFDLTHPNFYDTAAERCRIGAFWDQLAPNGDEDSALPVGREFVGTEAVLAQRYATDSPTQYHGTHTLGIATGSGYDTPYRGVAFDSDICLVANAVSSDTLYIKPEDYSKYTSATDALGFKYLFDYADRQGKPCVASFSEGYTPYLDEEDRLYNEALEQLTGPGHIIVASAGNESLNTTYAEKPADAEAAGAFVDASKQAARYKLKADGPMAMVLYAYGDDATITHTRRIMSDDKRMAGEDDELHDTLFIDNDTLAISISRYASEFEEGVTMYLLELAANKNLSDLPPLALVAEGLGTHVEIYGNSSSKLTKRHSTDARWDAAAQGHNILAPGCLPSVICVGATSYRTYYTDAEGKRHNVRYGENGQWATYSSTGPAMNGLNKPDVAAPGTNVNSSHNSVYLEQHPTQTGPCIAYSLFNERQYPWRNDTGTSMATPVAAGTIALWLEANPQLTRDDIMGVLSRTCRQPEADLTYPNGRYGYGEIDAYRGLLDVLGITGIKEISQTQAKGVSVWAEGGQLHLLFDQQPTKPLSLTIYSTSGAIVYQTTLHATQQHTTLALPITGRGVYVVQVPSGSALIRL